MYIPECFTTDSGLIFMQGFDSSIIVEKIRQLNIINILKFLTIMAFIALEQINKNQQLTISI